MGCFIDPDDDDNIVSVGELDQAVRVAELKRVWLDSTSDIADLGLWAADSDTTRFFVGATSTGLVAKVSDTLGESLISTG